MNIKKTENKPHSCSHQVIKSSQKQIEPDALYEGFYICPMHSEIRQQEPGECTICGMALEPESIDLNNYENPELVDFRYRFWIGLILTIPIVFIEMGSHFFKLDLRTYSINSDYIQFILAIPVVLWSGLLFFKRGLKSFTQGSLNMFTLISIGTGVALLYSIIAVLMPELFPASIRSGDGAIPIYFESASVIIILVLLGQILELKARDRTGDAIKNLLGLVPKTASRIIKGVEEEVSIDQINVGDQLCIRPGEKIPVDGIVIEGESYIDESMITGEPIPTLKTKNLSVIAATINGGGMLIMKAKKIGKDTMLSNIIDMVSKAQRSKAPMQRIADIISNYFTPIVILIAIIAFFSWLIFAPIDGFTYGILAAVSVLIIACPCALGLATPMSIMLGIGKGAKNGILVKDAESLEILSKVDTIILDKTGTLTEGKPTLNKIIKCSQYSEKELLKFAASIEQASEHPLAVAIIKKTQEANLKLSKIENFESIIGKGVKGNISKQKISLGNIGLMNHLKIDISHLANQIEELQKEGNTTMLIAINGVLAGIIAVSDQIKESTYNTLEQLRLAGIEVVMASGDNKNVADVIAKKLGIKKVYADVLPKDKQDIIEKYRKAGQIVAMAGDGINDAPALMAAHVGIAMGTGTDVAINSSGVILLHGDLSRIVKAINLSSMTIRNIKQNLFFAFFYNALGVPIAAGILYPTMGILLSPIIAAFAMSLSSVSVILNALRLNLQRI